MSIRTAASICVMFSGKGTIFADADSLDRERLHASSYTVSRNLRIDILSCRPRMLAAALSRFADGHLIELSDSLSSLLSRAESVDWRGPGKDSRSSADSHVSVMCESSTSDE